MTDSPAPFVGQDPDGRVRVELDQTGRVRSINLTGSAMESGPGRLAEALTDAFQQAQDAARSAAQRAAVEYEGLPPAERLQAAAADATAVAERRFEEITDVLYGLERRAEQSW